MQRDTTPHLSAAAPGWPDFGTDGQPVQPERRPLGRSVRHGEVNADGALTIKRGDDARTTLRLSSTPIGDLLPLRQVG